MDLEEQTLPYYLKVFSFVLIFVVLSSSFYIINLFNKNLILEKFTFKIISGDRLENILTKNVKNLSLVDIKIIKIYLKINNYLTRTFIHYGEFNFDNDTKILDLINIITKPSNVLNKITIIEGWSKKQLDFELSKHFENFHSIPYNELIADTYFIHKDIDFVTFTENLIKAKKNYFNKYQKNKLLNNFNQNEIIILGSLLEKEGLDNRDKKKISSVIFNRLKKNMKLQIDATVLFALTNGEYNLQRKLLLSDLKFDHQYNTYIHSGLPPKPISYVGKSTLDILFENYETDFLFYFFNKSLNKHIFSKTFREHKEKLNEYRNER